LCAAVGCSHPVATAPPRPADEDLPSLLPSGAEAVIDLDTEQLRRWPTAARLRSDVPGEARGRIDRLGFDLLTDSDRAVFGLTGLGSDGAALTVIARGRLDPAHLHDALEAGDAPLEEYDYHGARVVDGASRSFAILTPHAAAFGPRAEVRRAVDVTLGNDEGMRRDKAMEELFARLPTGKVGRPAGLAMMRVPPSLSARLSEAGLGAGEVRWIGAALAVGDGLDLGIVAGTPDPGRAVELQVALQRLLEDLRVRPSLRALGLAPFTEMVKSATKREELHLAFRVDDRHLTALLSRVERLLSAAQAER
jgi:hypothetical protein